MWTLKNPNSSKQRLAWWLPGAGWWGKWGDVGQIVQTSSFEMSMSGDLMCSIVIIVNNNVVYTRKSLR